MGCCVVCDAELPPPSAKNVTRRYCSPRCANRARRPISDGDARHGSLAGLSGHDGLLVMICRQAQRDAKRGDDRARAWCQAIGLPVE